MSEPAKLAMMPDLSNMEPVICPDCEQQLFVITLKDNPSRAEMRGCKCDCKVYEIPTSIVFGVQGTPLFLFKQKSK